MRAAVIKARRHAVDELSERPEQHARFEAASETRAFPAGGSTLGI